MASESEKGRAGLPFEPGKKKKKAADTDAKPAKADAKPKAEQKKKTRASDVSARAQARADEILAGNRRKKEKAKQPAIQTRRSQTRTKGNDSGAIPKEVSQRMLRRMGVLSGSPVFLGVGIFFLSYYLKSNEILDFPPVAVLLVTMGCFGLGVLGLTYGVLSASWDPEPGSLIGLSEFKLNFGRVMEARRASKT